MKVILAGGGTGGHIFPAISIAEEIERRSEKNKVLFVGTKTGLEKEIVPKNGFEIQFVNSKGIIGKGTLHKLRAIFSVLTSIISSFKILRNFKPDIVIGVGGYVSGPTVLAAYLNRIPSAICEQNFIPGFTNKVLSKFVKKIFISFDDGKKFFPQKKVVVTGNPVRTDLVDTIVFKSDRKTDALGIFIMGGSQGAKKLNNVVPESLKKVGIKNMLVVHQTGEKDKLFVKKKYKDLEIKAEVKSFIDNIKEVYLKSDLVISRAGASTISELSIMGKPSILIPYPYATYNHQLFNAKFMEKQGASILIEEKELNSVTLAEKISQITKKNSLNKMSEAAKKIGKPEAVKNIVDELASMIKK